MQTSLKDIVSRISLGALYPSMRVFAVDNATIEGVPIEHPGIVVILKVQDADTGVEKTLCHSFAKPEGLENETQAARWIFDKVQVVLMHELQEFFRFNGTKLKPPAHPIESKSL